MELEKIILNLEQQLLMPEVRQSAEKIAELLSDDFLEFCSSEKLYNYKKGDVFDKGTSLPVVEWKIADFSIKLLSADVVLATYKVTKHNEEDEKVYSLRSSIWKRCSDNWKMIFHQGTLTHRK